MTMSLEETVQRSWDEDRTGSRIHFLCSLLRLLSLPYRGAVALRNGLYDRGLFREMRLPCPVVSVGNITVGGTGKTPTAILLAKLLREKGHRPAVLSRGYGARMKAPVNVVSDGNRILMGWHEAGDEPVLIARSVPGVPVLTGPRRLLTARAAIGDFGADVLILDDAFQHRALYRDLDIVLIDATRPFGNGRLLPGGPLREPAEALGRAHLLIRTGGGNGGAEQPLPESPERPSFRGFHRSLGIMEGGTDRLIPAASLQGQKVCAFAGIGRPEAFRRSLDEWNPEIVSFRTFPDHHPYSRPDLDSLRRLAAKTGADRIITTEKDGIRLADFPDFLTEVSLLRIGMEITPADPFAELIFSRLGY
ncbi:MAG: tetraacyldisaccharide 4'-kinase [Syntrophus sp. (in: bacteria)]|nr:tetraacyldisaccharide 4'-kinase [Syntrophus sp. (in: bacteria)]